MNKSIPLILGLLAFALLLSGCSQTQDQQASGLESESNGLENSLNSADAELNDSGNGLEDIEEVVLPEGASESAGLELEEQELSQLSSELDSLDSELSDFSSIDSLDSVNPADLQ